MGYQTRFKLSFHDDNANTPKIVWDYLAKKGLIDEDFAFEADSDGRQGLDLKAKGSLKGMYGNPVF